MAAKKEHSETAAPRRPGRPRGTADGVDRRSQLLDAALRLFARQGIGETSLNAIAREAGVTPAMLHYYFNSREQLLDVMVSERFLPLREEIVTIFSQRDVRPAEALLKVTERMASLADSHPWFAPLWLQEAVGENNYLRQHLHARFGSSERAHAIDIIRRWQREGELNPQLAPALVFTSLLSLILVPFCLLRQRQPDGQPPAFDKAAIVNHALTLLKGGLGVAKS